MFRSFISTFPDRIEKFIWTLFIICLTDSISAQDFQKVKESNVYWISSEDLNLFPVPTLLEPQISFTPVNFPIEIAPGSGDPNVQTANPVSIQSCLCDELPIGQWDACMDINFRSLRDLGVVDDNLSSFPRCRCKLLSESSLLLFLYRRWLKLKCQLSDFCYRGLQ